MKVSCGWDGFAKGRYYFRWGSHLMTVKVVSEVNKRLIVTQVHCSFFQTEDKDGVEAKY